MASPEQIAVAHALSSIAPSKGMTLLGFGLIAEWEEPGGERLLTRLIGDGGNPWQVKGYFYDGLSQSWPPAGPGSEHHNPGHPSGWMMLKP